MSTATSSSVRSTFEPRDVAVLAALACMWGLSFLFIKVAVDVVSPLWIVAARCVVGALVLHVILRIRGTRLPRGWRNWGDLAFLAAFGNAIPWGLMAWAAQFLPSGLVSVVNALAPTSTMLIAVVIGLERPALRRFVGLGAALAGTALAVSSNLGVDGTIAAGLAVAAATVAYGAGTVYAKMRVSGNHPPLAIATGQVSVAAVMSVGAALLTSPLPDPAEITWTIGGSLVALGVLGTGFAFLAFYVLIERVGATNSIMVTYLIPVVALLAGALLLDEPLTLLVVGGTALTIGGIWLAQRERRPGPIEGLAEVPR
ncbi:DMT family transporter [Nitriliruptoraceae bacterium ZYF776]|nr:DMT family transporter [Profundirhabdus halotolerans]